jgi:hypothetical protein
MTERDELLDEPRPQPARALNVAELDRVLRFINQHRRQHNQSVWVHQSGSRPPEGNTWNCETTACLAGWTALLNGWAEAPHSTDVVWRRDAWGGVEERRVGQVAAELLGLTDEQADVFFTDTGSLEDLELLARVVRADPTATANELLFVLDETHYVDDDDDELNVERDFVEVQRPGGDA